ncbi:MAG TPA: hypothetical protein PLD79_10010, partial [Halothiobacillus sp.]|nr:hypothetical protein [Halothiobacillus sp.]
AASLRRPQLGAHQPLRCRRAGAVLPGAPIPGATPVRPLAASAIAALAGIRARPEPLRVVATREAQIA